MKNIEDLYIKVVREMVIDVIIEANEAGINESSSLHEINDFVDKFIKRHFTPPEKSP